MTIELFGKCKVCGHNPQHHYYYAMCDKEECKNKECQTNSEIYEDEIIRLREIIRKLSLKVKK